MAFERSLGWLADLIAQHAYRDAVPQPMRRRWDFTGDGWILSDDPVNGVMSITIDAAAVAEGEVLATPNTIALRDGDGALAATGLNTLGALAIEGATDVTIDAGDEVKITSSNRIVLTPGAVYGIDIGESNPSTSPPALHGRLFWDDTAKALFVRDSAGVETELGGGGGGSGDVPATADTLLLRDGTGGGFLTALTSPGELSLLSDPSTAVAVYAGGLVSQFRVTEEGVVIGAGDAEADQDGSIKIVGVSAPGGAPDAGSVFLRWNDTDKVFALRDSAASRELARVTAGVLDRVIEVSSSEGLTLRSSAEPINLMQGSDLLVYLDAGVMSFGPQGQAQTVSPLPAAASTVGTALTVKAGNAGTGGGDLGGDLTLSGGVGGSGTDNYGRVVIDLGYSPAGGVGAWLNVKDDTGNLLQVAHVYDTYVSINAGKDGPFTSTNMNNFTLESYTLEATAYAHMQLRTNNIMYIESSTYEQHGRPGVAYYFDIFASVTIATAATDNVATYAASDETGFAVEALLVISNNADNVVSVFHMTAVFLRTAGTLSQPGATDVIPPLLVPAGEAGLSAAIDFSGTDIRIRWTRPDTDSRTAKLTLTVSPITIT